MTELNTLTPKINVNEMIQQSTSQLRKHEAGIAEMRDKYLAMTISGVNDKKGQKLVSESRKEVKRYRCDFTNKAKDMRADATRYSKAVIEVENNIVDEIRKIEQHLIDEEQSVQKELDRIKAEEAAAKEAKIEARIERINENNLRVEKQLIQLMDDEDFEEYFTELQEAAIKEEQQREVERLKLEAEKEQLNKERRELEAEKQRLAEQARIADQKQAEVLEAERQELRRTAEAEEKVRAEERAKEQAELQVIRRVEAERQAIEQERLRKEQEATAVAEAQKTEELRLQREAELKPVREKLDAFASQLEQMEIPKGLSDIDGDIFLILERAAAEIRALAQ